MMLSLDELIRRITTAYGFELDRAAGEKERKEVKQELQEVIDTIRLLNGTS